MADARMPLDPGVFVPAIAGYYTANNGHQKNTGMDVAVTQMIRKTTDKSRGICLGNYQQIRVIENEELEKVWSVEKSAKQCTSPTRRMARPVETTSAVCPEVPMTQDMYKKSM